MIHSEGAIGPVISEGIANLAAAAGIRRILTPHEQTMLTARNQRQFDALYSLSLTEGGFVVESASSRLTEPELIIWDNVDEAKRHCSDFFTVKRDREPCGGHTRRSLIEAGWDKNILMGDK